MAPSPTLTAALDAAREAYAKRNPNSLVAFNKATVSLPGGGTRTTLITLPFPLFIESGSGATVTDVDGHTYRDFLSDFTSGIYGKSNDILRGAITKALASGLQFGAHTTHEARLADHLTSRFPSMDLVRFANSGTEANLLAITTALKHTKRKKVVVFSGGYHGSLLAHFHTGEPGGNDVPGALRVPFDFIIAPYNDIEGTKALLSPVAKDVGVVIVEPMLGAGGCIPADPAFLQGLRDYTKEIDSVLIFDEVQTSRLATGGRQSLLGITPDMTTVGKFFGGGFAFGAFGGKAEIMSIFDVRRPDHVNHGGTFNNSPLTMIAGSTAIEQILTPERLEDLNERGDRLREKLNSAFGGAGAPFVVTGLGSINQINCHLPKDDQLPALELVYFGMLERGFWMAQRGTLALNFEITDKDVDEFVEAIVESSAAVVKASA
ncbi:Beta-phenylalanine transaminase [Vanrija pseudolonga]|uniref:Beta-phenylalanine transaminase n=1 Tax=Vanrija pseudolonga TaxID=143232 RepID=A0AAF1BMU7_9TREE|nr:Beta-phenylalanine transaminase [Vanrija pseudolonga]